MKARYCAIGLGMIASFTLLLGCERTRETKAVSTGGISEELSREADAVMHLLGLTELVFALGLVGLAWVSIRLIQGGATLLWHMGLDARRRLAPISSVLNALILAAVVFLLLRRLLLSAPAITLLALTVVSGAIVIVFSNPIQNAWAGFLLSFRHRLRVGDRVTVEGQVGIIQDVNLTQLLLRSADGASILIPNKMVFDKVVRVEQVKNTETVNLRMKSSTELTGEAVKAVRRAALFSPFRVPGTLMEVRVDERGELLVAVQVWSDRAVREARIHLEERIQAVLRSSG